jgi:hypothetical protein
MLDNSASYGTHWRSPPAPAQIPHFSHSRGRAAREHSRCPNLRRVGAGRSWPSFGSARLRSARLPPSRTRTRRSARPNRDVILGARSVRQGKTGSFRSFTNVAHCPTGRAPRRSEGRSCESRARAGAVHFSSSPGLVAYPNADTHCFVVSAAAGYYGAAFSCLAVPSDCRAWPLRSWSPSCPAVLPTLPTPTPLTLQRLTS